MSAAYLLIAHGSRDPRPQEALATLTHALVPHLQRRDPGSSVGVAYLELQPVPLHTQILEYIRDRAHLRRLVILPLFLLPGVHVREDIPAELDQVRHQLPSYLTLEQRPYLGSHPGLVLLLRRLLRQLPSAEPPILLAHGSRRPGGNAPIERLAQQLEAQAAYWAVPPQLPECIATCVQRGQTQVAIQPYFLFPGGITEAIAQEIDQLRLQFAATQLHMGQPLNQAPEFTRLVLDGLIPTSRGDG